MDFVFHQAHFNECQSYAQLLKKQKEEKTRIQINTTQRKFGNAIKQPFPINKKNDI